MNIFSLAHINELAQRLPDPSKAVHRVLRLPLVPWNAVDDAGRPSGEFEEHSYPYVEFEIVYWKNRKGVSAPRWVLRGLVAI
jgi:hypothetical protein